MGDPIWMFGPAPSSATRTSLGIRVLAMRSAEFLDRIDLFVGACPAVVNTTAPAVGRPAGAVRRPGWRPG